MGWPVCGPKNAGICKITRLFSISNPSQDKECLATLKHYRSLVPMGQESRKPIFHLTSTDGAIGGHSQAVQEAYKDFKDLAEELMKRMEAAKITQTKP